MTLTLEIQPECLCNPTRLDLVDIEAIMLWPNDPAARQLWWRAAALEEALPHVDDLPIDALRQYARDAMTIPRVSELNRRNGKRIIHGQLLGTIVFEATYLSRHEPERAALYKVQADLCRRLRGTFQIQPQTMNNKDGPIAPMRPAAHMWAAYMYRTIQGDSVFPCRLSEIGRFLATAEAIRHVAETRRAPKAKSAILREDETVKLPQAILAQLPSVSFEGTL